MNPEEQIAALQSELETCGRQLTEAHKLASLGRLLASIVHEINTPIGSILSNNEVIIRSLDLIKKSITEVEPPNLQKAKDILETCRSLSAVDKIACERISSVIRGLKTFARVDTEVAMVDLRVLIESMIKLTHGEFRRRVLVETDFEDVPKVECHAQFISQVLLNILVNAGQAIEGEGKITVRLRREDSLVHMSISDTGPGIKPENRTKIFSSGFTTKPMGEGTGLGLTISKQIIEETHGGSLDFETEEGVGTTFHIRLPIVHARQAAQ